MYAWIIDKDHLDDGEAKGVRGPKHMSEALSQALDKGEGKPFRIFDDDGGLYYEGRLVVSEDDNDPEVEFHPLHDFGMPNAGATEIHYRDESGNWVQV